MKNCYRVTIEKAPCLTPEIQRTKVEPEPAYMRPVYNIVGTMLAAGGTSFLLAHPSEASLYTMIPEAPIYAIIAGVGGLYATHLASRIQRRLRAGEE